MLPHLQPQRPQHVAERRRHLVRIPRALPIHLRTGMTTDGIPQDRQCPHEPRHRAYGSLIFTGGIGNPRTTFSYKSGGRPQSSRRRICTSVNGDNRACACPLLSTTLTLIVFITLSSSCNGSA